MEGTCGEGVSYELIELPDETYQITISASSPSKMDDFNNRTKRVPWFDDRANISTIIIGDNITHIGNFTFMYCTNLVNLTLGKNVETIGKNAFCFCENLHHVEFPSKLKEIGNNAFDFCDLFQINLPDGLLKIGEEAFRYNSDAGNVTKDPFATNLFYKFREIFIPRSIKEIGLGAFAGMIYTFRLVIKKDPNGDKSIPEAVLHYCNWNDTDYVLEEERGEVANV